MYKEMKMYPITIVLESCEICTNVCTWNRVSVPHSQYKENILSEKKMFFGKNYVLTKDPKFLEFTKSLS